MRTKKPVVGKWCIVYGNGVSPMFNSPFVRLFTFGVIKLKREMPEGERLSRPYYNGYILSFLYSIPVARVKY